MTALGFSEKWRNLVMRCVTTVSFSVRVNGQYSSVFKPSLGIRQGDPISPYLFLLFSEGLSCMLKEIGPRHIYPEELELVYMHLGSHIFFLQMTV
jgi:hypothetical protein